MARNDSRESLADLIESVCGRDIGLQADTILASDWLAAHDARVAADARADEREKVAQAIEDDLIGRNLPHLTVNWLKHAALIARAATDTEAGQ